MIVRSRSAVGMVAFSRWFNTFPSRCVIFAPLIFVCLLFAVFPQRYLALATLSPVDPATLGLSGTLSQLGALNNPYGSQVAVEMSLRIGNSEDVRDLVIKRLDLERRLKKRNLKLRRWLSQNVEVHALRGGIVQIDMKNTDPKLAQDIVMAYTGALRDRLGQISRDQTSYKRKILDQLVGDASESLAQAQARYDTYRLNHREAAPEGETQTLAFRIASLEASVRGQQIALATARRIYTDQNPAVKQLLAQMDATSRQLAQAKVTSPNGSQDVGSVVASTNILFKLEHELLLQRTLYDSYIRFLQSTSIEDLASIATVRILEPPHIDSGRHYGLRPLAIAIGLILVWAAIEFYRIRPPLGDGGTV